MHRKRHTQFYDMLAMKAENPSPLSGFRTKHRPGDDSTLLGTMAAKAEEERLAASIKTPNTINADVDVQTPAAMSPMPIQTPQVIAM